MDVYARRGCRHDRPMPNGREELEDGETLASMMIRCILLLKCYTAVFSRERVLYLSHRSLPGTTSARVYERYGVCCVLCRPREALSRQFGRNQWAAQFAGPQEVTPTAPPRQAPTPTASLNQYSSPQLSKPEASAVVKLTAPCIRSLSTSRVTCPGAPKKISVIRTESSRVQLEEPETLHIS
eukprot:scaffold160_cov188-Alexandrium_tamarense.AAC.12